MRRSRMPVRVTIHSSEVSTIRSRSAFVKTCSGRAMPHPVMAAFRTFRGYPFPHGAVSAPQAPCLRLAARPPDGLAPGRGRLLLLGLTPRSLANVDDLAALIGTAVRADVVRPLLLAARGTGHQLRQLEPVMPPPVTLPVPTDLLLGKRSHPPPSSSCRHPGYARRRDSITATQDGAARYSVPSSSKVRSTAKRSSTSSSAAGNSG